MTTLPLSVDEAISGPRPEELSEQQLLETFRLMSRIRRFEEQVVEASLANLVPGSTHPCIGQEATKVAAILALRPSDYVLATYRGHGEALAKGCDPLQVMAEIMCRATGLCSGKGGSMHMSAPELGLLATNGIVAGHIPMAGGVALSCQRRGLDAVVACFFGDGAACEGEFFETLNMASLWKVPLVFICENNGWAISVPTSQSQATPDIADRAAGFGMPSAIVDGNDPVQVWRAVTAAAARARSGDGPTLIECKTVRWERHSALSAGGSDPDAQRRAWQRVDPIPRFRQALLEWGVADERMLNAIDETAVAEAAAVRKAAEAAPFPGPEAIYEHIFASV
jgi:TPP-dependent pyruvate/acetoin dehydrogenase alpha subunit